MIHCAARRTISNAISVVTFFSVVTGKVTRRNRRLDKKQPPNGEEPRALINDSVLSISLASLLMHCVNSSTRSPTPPV